jgi:hypothetical protein
MWRDYKVQVWINVVCGIGLIILAITNRNMTSLYGGLLFIAMGGASVTLKQFDDRVGRIEGKLDAILQKLNEPGG